MEKRIDNPTPSTQRNRRRHARLKAAGIYPAAYELPKSIVSAVLLDLLERDPAGLGERGLGHVELEPTIADLGADVGVDGGCGTGFERAGCRWALFDLA